MFGSETWVLNPCMGQALGSFQHRVNRKIIGRQPKKQEDGEWEYPPLETAMEEAGFEDMGDYVLKRQNTVAKYITTRPIMDLYKKTVRRPGVWVARRWREKEGLELAGEKAAAEEAADRGEESEG